MIAEGHANEHKSELEKRSGDRGRTGVEGFNLHKQHKTTYSQMFYIHGAKYRTSSAWSYRL